jgi:hypothetical protein
MPQLLRFKLDRADVAEMRVPAGGVVEALDVVADGGGAEGAGGEILVVDMLRLEGGEEALGDGVVVAVTGATHAGDDPAVDEGLPILVAGVGTTAIGVVEKAPRRATRAHGVCKGVQGCYRAGLMMVAWTGSMMAIIEARLSARPMMVLDQKGQSLDGSRTSSALVYPSRAA